MSRVNASLVLSDTMNNVNYGFSDVADYKQVFQIDKVVDSTPNPETQKLISFTPGTKGGTVLDDFEFMCIYNKGIATLEIRVVYTDMNDSSGADVTVGSPAHGIIAYLLRPSEFMVFPNMWGCNYNAVDQSAANTTVRAMDNTVVSGALLRDSGDDSTDDLVNGTELASDATATVFNVDDGGYYLVGDLIRLDDEIMRITAISTNQLTVERGVYGSAASTHADNVKVQFPYFNAYHDFNTFAKPQTDASGNYKSFNFFGGRGRNDADHATKGAQGVCRGSVALKFYEPAYIEFGKSNITPNGNSGLSANTAYAFDLILNEVVGKDSATAKGTISFTTDATNVKWGNAVKGGTGTGVLQKIKNAMDVRFRTVSDALAGLDCDIRIIDGDIRFISHSRLSNSRVGLSVASTGTNVWGNGDFPGVNSNLVLCEGSRQGSGTNQVTYGDAARLPDDRIYENGLFIKNEGAFLIDNGRGQFVKAQGGVASGERGDPAGETPETLGTSSVSSGIPPSVSGTIDYRSGRIDIKGAPANAEFVVSALFNTAIGTGGGDSNNGILQYVAARSITQKIDGKVQLIAFGVQ